MMIKTKSVELPLVHSNLKERKPISATLNMNHADIETVVILADNNGQYEKAVFLINGDGWIKIK